MPPAPGTTFDLVRDFGATPNDAVSDADALIRAIATLRSGQTLTIPAGRFIIDKCAGHSGGRCLQSTGWRVHTTA